MLDPVLSYSWGEHGIQSSVSDHNWEWKRSCTKGKKPDKKKSYRRGLLGKPGYGCSIITQGAGPILRSNVRLLLWFFCESNMNQYQKIQLFPCHLGTGPWELSEAAPMGFLHSACHSTGKLFSAGRPSAWWPQLCLGYLDLLCLTEGISSARRENEV